MKLSDPKVKNAKPEEKTRWLSDGRGLSLEITPQGGKRWRYRYRINGKPS